MYIVVYKSSRSSGARRTFRAVPNVFAELAAADEQARKTAAFHNARAYVVDFPDPPLFEIVDAPASRDVAPFIPPAASGR